MRTSLLNPFIKLNAHPFEAFNDILLCTGYKAILICVFDAKYHGSAVLAGKQVIVKGSADAADVQRAGGAGLGLAICREVMANLGGTVSYLPGQRGAAFRVTVPLRLEKQAA